MDKRTCHRSIGITQLVVLIAATLLSGCEREERQLRLDPPVAAGLEELRLMPNRISGAPPEVYFAMGKPYEVNAYNLSQGKRLYSWFGCTSCHGTGEGGTGPAFLDGWWAYGPEMVSIAASIRDGRPNGMPAFKDKLTSEQIWQLAGYIKVLGAYSAITAAPARNDDKHTRPAENRAPAAILFNEGPTKAGENQEPAR